MLMWSDDSLVNYVNWFGGQPGPAGDCVEMSTSGAGGWSTSDCNMNKNYVCKAPLCKYQLCTQSFEPTKVHDSLQKESKL